MKKKKIKESATLTTKTVLDCVVPGKLIIFSGQNCFTAEVPLKAELKT